VAGISFGSMKIGNFWVSSAACYSNTDFLYPQISIVTYKYDNFMRTEIVLLSICGSVIRSWWKLNFGGFCWDPHVWWTYWSLLFITCLVYSHVFMYISINHPYLSKSAICWPIWSEFLYWIFVLLLGFCGIESMALQTFSPGTNKHLK